MENISSVATQHVIPTKRVPITHQNFDSSKDMFGMTRSIIPSVLLTKENLLDPKQKIKTHKWNMLRTQSNNSEQTKERRNWNTIEGDYGKNVNRYQTEAISSEHFLPNIDTAYSKTSEGARWKMTSSTEGYKKSYSVLSKRSTKENKPTKTRMHKLKQEISVPPQAGAAKKRLRNIKFWSEATSLQRRNINQITQEKTAETETQLGMAKRILEENAWSKKYSTDKDNTENCNQFYARHISLRDRLISFETMHYREAITRINRYRKKLKKSIIVPQTHTTAIRGGYGAITNKVTTEHAVKSPCQEAKSMKDHQIQLSQHGIRLSPSKEWKPFLDENHKSQRNERKLLQTHDKSRQRSRKKITQTCDTALADRETIMTANSTGNKSLDPLNVKRLLKAPTLTEKIKTRNKNCQTTDVTKIKSFVQGMENDSIQSDAVKINEKLDCVHSEKELINHDYNIKESNIANHTSISAKLRLLLQNSSQSQRENNVLTTNAKKQLEEKLPSEEKRLKVEEKIPSKNSEENIISKAATIGRLTMTPRRDEKHLFMMRSVNKKETMKPLPEDHQKHQHIGEMYKKNISNGQYQNTSVSNVAFFKPKNMTHGKRELTNILADLIVQPRSNYPGWIQSTTTRESKTAVSLSSRRAIPKRTPKSRPLIKPQNHNNQTEKLEDQMIVQPEKKVEHPLDNIKRQISVVATPTTANKLSQFKKMDNLVYMNLTDAILNSELSLRAPSSSPIDFLQKFHNRHKTAERRQNRSAKFQAFDMPVKYRENTSENSPIQMKNETHINKIDGLAPSNLPLENARLHLPRVSDLLDLQQLYLFKHSKQGKAQHLQVHTSSLGTAQPFQRLEYNDATLKKRHYYHYPYPNQIDNAKIKAPLYVVTGVKKIQKPNVETRIKLKNDIRVVRKEVNQDETKQKNTTDTNAVYHSPFPDHPELHSFRQNSPGQMKYTGYDGIRSITVSMLRTPHAVPLAQIKEHSVD